MKKIKKIIISAAIIMTIMSTGLAEESHALIGLAFRSKPVKVIGAVGLAGGAVVGIYGYATALTAADLGAVLGGAILTGYGAIIAGVGLVILDEKQIADIEFQPIDVGRSELYQGFSRQQVETYNSELAQLNSIRQTMIAESNELGDTADAETLWKNYSQYLSKDTVLIAQKNAARFLEAIH